MPFLPMILKFLGEFITMKMLGRIAFGVVRWYLRGKLLPKMRAHAAKSKSTLDDDMVDAFNKALDLYDEEKDLV